MSLPIPSLGTPSPGLVSAKPIGPEGAKLLILGEALGENEEIFGQPFVGAAGRELRAMLMEVGLVQASPGRERLYTSLNEAELLSASIRLDNVFMERPAGNKLEALCEPKSPGYPNLPALIPGKYLSPARFHHLVALDQRLRQARPNLILACGNTPCWFLLGTQKISRLRGYLHESPYGKVLPTFHPAAVLRNWPHRPTVLADLLKAKLEMSHPEIIRPERELWICPTLQDISKFFYLHLFQAREIGVDIETAGGLITCIGFSAGPTHALVIPFIDRRQSDRLYWRDRASFTQALGWVKKILELPQPKVLQNGMYDIQWLWSLFGFTPRNWSEDTMLRHWSMWPEAPKSLEFLGSVYTNEAPWKFWHRSSSGKREE